MTMVQSKLDPITSRVIGGALQQTAVEMGYKLTRMSYSSLIRESEDFGAALLDSSGTLLCESTQSTPLQLGPIPGYLRGIKQIMTERDGEFHEGDVILHNSPYHGATHGPDIGICVPVYLDSELIGFSFITAHQLDIGGMSPGTCLIEAVDAYAEGLQFKALKLFDRGRPNEELWHLLRDNLRAADLVLGDVGAMVATARIGAERFIDLVNKYGLDNLLAASEDLIAYSERMLRSEIQRLPDGEYFAEGFIDGYQEHEDPAYKNLKIAVRLVIEGSDVTVDLTGTAKQLSDLPINMPFHGTLDVAVWMAIRSVLFDSERFHDIPQNEGILRPIKIIAPKGSIANPVFPAPTIARFCAGAIVTDTIIRAFAQIVPEYVAAGAGNLKVVNYVGLEEGEYWVYLDIHEGASGGRFQNDGMDAVDPTICNTRNTPIEDIETHYPLRVQRYELLDDRGGAGKWRGGLGSIREVTLLEEGRILLEGDGHAVVPPGILGGLPGAAGEIVRDLGRPTEKLLTSKVISERLPAETRFRTTSPCGGGYGDPLDRDAELVHDDVLDGVVSIESAQRLYGVVIDADTIRLNREETKKMRALRRKN